MSAREVEVSNPDRIYFPSTPSGPAITKADVVAHYARVGEVMLEHLVGRPFIVERFPRGIEAKGFYQKNAPSGLPDSIQTIDVETNDGPHRYPLVGSVEDLLWFANKGAVVFHQWLNRPPDLHLADQIMFDLDPSTDDIGPVQEAAAAVRQLLVEIGFAPTTKSSGSRGLHVTIRPADAVPSDKARAFSMLVASAVAERQPEQFTVEFRKKKRAGRLFIDVLRNGYGAHAAAPFTLRAMPGAPVAIPLSWDEALAPDLDVRGVTLRTLTDEQLRSAPTVDALRVDTQTVDAAAQLLLEMTA